MQIHFNQKIQVAPLQIAVVHSLEEHLRRGDVRRQRNAVLVAQRDHVVELYLIVHGAIGISQENNHIQLVLFDHHRKLLLAAEASGQKLMNVKVRSLLDHTPRDTRRIELVLAQNSFIGDAEILHQCFSCIISNQSDIHDNPSLSGGAPLRPSSSPPGVLHRRNGPLTDLSPIPIFQIYCSGCVLLHHKNPQ